MYNNLYYDRQNKRFYVIEPHMHDAGGILVVDYEKYVDVTDEILEFVHERTKDNIQALCIDTTKPLPDTVYYDGYRYIHCGNPCPTVTAEKCEEDFSLSSVETNSFPKD